MRALTKGEIEIVLAIMAGHTTGQELATATDISKATAYGYLHKIYFKSGAINMAQVVLMMTGVTPCSAALLSVQRAWRRKHYKLDEI